MNKKPLILTLIATVVILAVAVFFVLRGSSYGMALNKAGVDKDRIVTVDAGINANGDEYRVVAQYATEDNAKIAYLQKNRIGFWQVENAATGSMSWQNVSAIHRFSPTDANVSEFETHVVYSDSDADGPIQFSEDTLPHNVTVSIHQSGSAYLLHFVTYGDPAVLNELPLP